MWHVECDHALVKRTVEMQVQERGVVFVVVGVGEVFRMCHVCFETVMEFYKSQTATNDESLN